MRPRMLLVAVVVLIVSRLALAQSTGNLTVDVKQLMSASEFQQCGLQKLSDSELRNLDGWMGKFALKIVTAEENSAQSATSSFNNLEGAVIVADDGQFLGKITTNDVDPNSILNDVGQYGSDVSSVSIFNDVSKYGSDVSSLSPFDSVTSTPPQIFIGSKFVAYLTVNTVKTPRIDPRALIGWLKSQQ